MSIFSIYLFTIKTHRISGFVVRDESEKDLKPDNSDVTEISFCLAIIEREYLHRYLSRIFVDCGYPYMGRPHII